MNRCPYCGQGIHFSGKKETFPSKESSSKGFEIKYDFCPLCKKLIIILYTGDYKFIDDDEGELITSDEIVLYPKSYTRVLSDTIPLIYRELYAEANSIVTTSPRASATLSRRLLQQIIRDEFHISKNTLHDEISEFVKLPQVPQNVKEVVDTIRQIGNWGAHPSRFANTNEIVEVEKGEADWLLDIIEDILDFYFVQSAKAKERQSNYNIKLQKINSKKQGK